MIQGQVAEDLGAYEEAMWFTTAFFIPASSLAPVAGRLADIFSPRSLIIPVAVLIAAGSLIASLAKTFAVFILGRSLTGAGCGGVLTLSVILVLDLTTKRKRGLFIGLLNAGYTIGISSGAVVFGALLPVIGWVSSNAAVSWSWSHSNIIATLVLDSSPCCYCRWYRHLPEHPELDELYFTDQTRFRYP